MQTVLPSSLFLLPSSFFFSSFFSFFSFASSRLGPLPFCNSPTRLPRRMPPLLIEPLRGRLAVRLRPTVAHRPATHLRPAATTSSSLPSTRLASSRRARRNLALLNSSLSPIRRLPLLPLVTTASPNRSVRRRASPSADYLPPILSMHELVVASAEAQCYPTVGQPTQLCQSPPVVSLATTVAYLLLPSP